MAIGTTDRSAPNMNDQNKTLVKFSLRKEHFFINNMLAVYPMPATIDKVDAMTNLTRPLPIVSSMSLELLEQLFPPTFVLKIKLG